jgi:rhamnulokinase
VAGPVEATVIGNLLIQGIALGEIGSLEDARRVVRDSFLLRTYEPEDDTLWLEARARFDAITSFNRQLTKVEA